MFGIVYAAEGTPREVLEAVAREFSPRIEVLGAREIALDLAGLTRLFGDARTIAGELRRTAADRGLRVRVAIAGTRSAARMLVRHRAGLTVVEPGREAAALAPLPLSLLNVFRFANGSNASSGSNASKDSDVLLTLRRWGLRTLGEFAALPPDEVAARLGPRGPEGQRLAQGHDPRPLVPSVPEERFEQALDLDWPIEGLEPLSFVLGRLLEPLEAHLARRDRGAAVLHVRLHLVTRAIHARSLQLPAPMREARALRTLALLDLDSHPPAAAIDRVVVAVDPTPGRIVQHSLLTRALPSPERLSTLIARLSALMGEGRCGSPALVDSWQPGAFAMQPFAPRDSGGIDPPEPHRRVDLHEPQRHRGTELLKNSELVSSVPSHETAAPAVALRRVRIPIPARVRVAEGRPVRVTIDRRPSSGTRGGFGGGAVAAAAGPWRTSGGWWGPPLPGADAHGEQRTRRSNRAWDRDEWDVSLSDGATYRLFRDRETDAWFVEGLVD